MAEDKEKEFEINSYEVDGKEMLAIDSRALRTYMTKVMPDIDLQIELQDDASGEPFEIDLPIDINFFWPSV